MKIYTDISKFKNVLNPVVTTGTFDGVHLGHQKIFERLREIAKKENGETVLLTFYPHPRMVLFPEDDQLRLLTTEKEKSRLLEEQGIDHLIIYPFTKQFSRLSSVEFVRNILINEIHTYSLVIGYNHHFGRNREGSFKHLKEYAPVYGFKVEEIPAVDLDNVEVSSTKIRKALEQGDVPTANEYLGYAYSVEGIVVKGKQIGRTLGYPTANIQVQDKYKLIPADGIYAVTVDHKEKNYKGMLSIGMNPTVNGKNKTIEVNIFNFDKDIYQEEIRVNFIQKIREEIKFDSLDALKERMKVDEQETMKILAK
jgi:riboflavin kinase/FMN adenylyltransferase